MSGKSTRLNVRRECDRADGNLEWAAKHLMYVANVCEDQKREDLQEQAEYLIMLTTELKTAVKKLQDLF